MNKRKYGKPVEHFNILYSEKPIHIIERVSPIYSDTM